MRVFKADSLRCHLLEKVDRDRQQESEFRHHLAAVSLMIAAISVGLNLFICISALGTIECKRADRI